MSFVKLIDSGAYRASWTEVLGTSYFDRSLTFVPTSTPGDLTMVYAMMKEYLAVVWTHALTVDAIIVNLAVTELATGTSLHELAPGIHGRQDPPMLDLDKTVVMHLDSEYRNSAWNTRLYRRGTAQTLTVGDYLTKTGKDVWALVGSATVALLLDSIGESYHQLVLVGDGKDVMPDPDPGVLYVTPVAFIRIGGTLVKAPPHG